MEQNIEVKTFFFIQEIENRKKNQHQQRTNEFKLRYSNGLSVRLYIVTLWCSHFISDILYEQNHSCFFKFDKNLIFVMILQNSLKEKEK